MDVSDRLLADTREITQSTDHLVRRTDLFLLAIRERIRKSRRQIELSRKLLERVNDLETRVRTRAR